MICKCCGHLVEKGWKYCPSCSARIPNKNFRNIGIIVLVIGMILFFIIVKNIIEENDTLDQGAVVDYLEDKYDEEFDDIQLFKSVENPDQTLSCDGSNLGTIEGEGTTEYYKLYSKKNNMEFYAYYDTSDKEKTINDTYDDFLTRREIILQAYDVVNEYLKENINNIYLYNGLEKSKLDITSKTYLYDELSEFDDINNYSNSLYIVIEADIYDFSKGNYELLTKLNEVISILKKEYYFSMFIVFNDDAKIELDRLDGKAYVYDKYETNAAWGEKLDDFVLREDY